MKKIFEELLSVDQLVDPHQKLSFIDTVSQRKNGTLIGLGAGRMGYSLRSFIMRMSHLKYQAFMIGDTSLPKLSRASTIIVNSSSGETRSIVLLTEIAKDAGATILSVTCNSHSTIGRMSDGCIEMPSVETLQPMKTIYEQYTMLLFDELAQGVQQQLGITTESMSQNHSILE